MLDYFATVFFKATGDDMGKFLSLCRENNLPIRNFKKYQKSCVGYISPKDYKKIVLLGKNAGVKIKIIKKRGILFFVRRYRKRLGIFIGGILAVITLLFLQNFVWAIDVYGNEELLDTHILSVARDNGLKIGTFLPTKDLEMIELFMLKELPAVSFLSLNKIGSRVEIEVSEEVPKPMIIKNNVPCNIVALKTGTILSSEVYAGQKMFKEGDTVYKGDLLVSGIVESADRKITYHHALAKIIAKTKFIKEFSFSLNQVEKSYTGKEKNRYRIDILGKKLPLFVALPQKENYDSKRSIEPLKVFNLVLPFGIEKETLNFYELKSITFTEEEGLEIIKKNIIEYENEELENAEILSKEMFASVNDNLLIMRVEYQCKEEISLYKKLDADIDYTLPSDP